MTLTPLHSNTWSSGASSSTYSSLYARPEQPVVRTPTRRPTPLPRRVRYFCTCCAAFSVNVIAIAFLIARCVDGARVSTPMYHPCAARALLPCLHQISFVLDGALQWHRPRAFNRSPPACRSSVLLVG